MSKNYIKNPEIIEAVYWDGTNLNEVKEFLDGHFDSISKDNVLTVKNEFSYNRFYPECYIYKQDGEYFGYTKKYFEEHFKPVETDYLERMKTEYAELSIKIGKIEDFQKDLEKMEKLDEADEVLLSQQYISMVDYYNYLYARIRKAEKKRAVPSENKSYPQGEVDKVDK